MATASPATLELAPESVPRAVRDLLDALAAAGWPSFLAGRCVRELLQGQPASDFEVATPASAKDVLALFPNAVPTDLRFETVTVPSAAGPVDVAHFRAGSRVEDDLARRDFGIHAIAFDPRSGQIADPFSGRADLAARRLRAVGSPESCLAVDPVRALRAARLVGSLGLATDPELEAAMHRVRGRLPDMLPVRLRTELCALLVSPGAEQALALLRRSGIEAVLFPGVAEDAAQVVARLPQDLELRLAAWLRGARASSSLRRLRFPRSRVAAVEALLRMHPVDRSDGGGRSNALRRLVQRVGNRDLDRLLALRTAEIEARCEGPRAREALHAFREALERARQGGELAQRRTELALDGRAVMEHLGCGPGPRVGRALQHLTRRIAADPSLNHPEALRALLDAWSRDGGA